MNFTVLCPEINLKRINFKTKISFRGGMTGGSCPSKDNWKFDATTTEWTRLEECSTPRMYSSMAMLPPLTGTERRAVLYGGAETSKSVLVVSEVCSQPK